MGPNFFKKIAKMSLELLGLLLELLLLLLLLLLHAFYHVFIRRREAPPYNYIINAYSSKAAEGTEGCYLYTSSTHSAICSLSVTTNPGLPNLRSAYPKPPAHGDRGVSPRPDPSSHCGSFDPTACVQYPYHTSVAWGAGEAQTDLI